jgi:hypothetical protein
MARHSYRVSWRDSEGIWHRWSATSDDAASALGALLGTHEIADDEVVFVVYRSRRRRRVAADDVPRGVVKAYLRGVVEGRRPPPAKR